MIQKANCVQKFIYRTMTSVHNGDPLPVKRYEHVVHCLDQLRQDVHCQADDVRIIFPSALKYIAADFPQLESLLHWGHQCRTRSQMQRLF